MSRFHLQCGNRSPDSVEETAVLGNSVSTGGNLCTLSGMMSRADQPQGILAIVFEHTHDEDEHSIRYTGRLLCDRDILTGEFEAAGGKGDFLFKKVPQSYILCSRPLIPKLDTKELWSFACNAIIDSIRRKKLGLSYLHLRMTDMGRLVRLMYKEDSNLLTEADEVEYVKVQKTFTFEEISELSTLCMWYNRTGRRQPSTS